MNRVLTIFNRSQFINTKRFFSINSTLYNKVYTDSEEWISNNKIGISKYGLEQLSEIIYLEFSCEEGDNINKGEDIAIIESVKAAESIETPYDCIILENNINLDIINNNPECDDNSWIVKIKKL